MALMASSTWLVLAAVPVAAPLTLPPMARPLEPSQAPVTVVLLGGGRGRGDGRGGRDRGAAAQHSAGDVDAVGRGGAGTDLEGQGGGGARGEHGGAIELGACHRAVDFGLQLLEFLLQVVAVAGAVGGVAGLDSQFTHALQVVADLAEGAFSGLRQRDAVVGIAHGDVHAFDLGAHALGDGQTGGIVLGRVDAQARGQALHGCREAALRCGQVALGVHRNDVGVDRGGHDVSFGDVYYPAIAPANKC